MAVTFNGTSNHLLIADNAALTLPDGDWTIAMRHLPSNPLSHTYRLLLCWGAFGAIPSLQWQFSNDHLIFKGKDDDGTTLSPTTSSGTPGAASAWQSFVLVRNGDVFTQYINGSADGQRTVSGFNAINVNDGLYLAAYRTLSASYFLAGKMADVAKWDRALSTSEISAIAAGACSSFFPKDLVWSLPLLASARSEFGGLSVTDNSGGLVEHPPKVFYPGRPRIVRAAASIPGSIFRSAIFHSPIFRGLGA